MSDVRPCPLQEEAAAYALGGLAQEEHERFRAHLDEGCPACAIELRAARRTLARMDLELVQGEARREPPAELKQRLLQRIEPVEAAAPAPRRAWQQWSGDPEDLEIVRGSEAGFEPTDFEGVEVRPLSVDSARESVTMLVRMAPGASYPEHRHAAREECYVLSGDLQVGEKSMQAGDYQVAPAGSVHETQSTRGGCTLLIVSSQRDELLA